MGAERKVRMAPAQADGRRGWCRVPWSSGFRGALAGLLAASLCVLRLGLVCAQDEPRLYDLEPYDVLTLKSGEVFKLKPLELRDRMLPRNPKPDDTLQIRLFDRPQQVYEVAWANIQSVKLFEELLLEQAAALVEAKRFDEAFRYYRALESRFGNFRGVAAAVQAALFHEAEWWRQQGNLNQALALLIELHRRNAEYPQLGELLGSVVSSLLTPLVEENRAEAAAQLLQQWSQRYPNDERLAAWRQRFAERAQAALEQAQQFAAQEQWFLARAQAITALAWQPDLEEAKALCARATAQYPTLGVGVVEAAGCDRPWQLPTWADRRVARLVARALCEPVAADAGSLRYASPLGELETDASRLVFRLRAHLAWGNGQPATAAELARALTSHDQLGRAPSWKRVFARAAASSENVLTIDLRGPHAAPLGFLNVPLWHDVGAGSATTKRAGQVGLGAFVWQSREGELDRFVRNPAWPWTSDAGLREIVERQFGSTDAALQALQRGEVLLVDRISPRDAARLAQHEAVKVAAYALPTVHLLLFHPHRPHTQRALFRRALAHATSRESIVAQLASGAPERAVSPLRNVFPLGTPGAEQSGVDDFDPALAAALFAACRESNERARIVLAHPATAQEACRILATQWALAGHGPDVQLVELPAGGPAAGPLPEFDVLYVEWPGMDPLADGVRLCALEPLAHPGGPLLARAAAALTEAADGAAARRAIAAVARAMHARTLVIPLWQTTEYQARHRSLSGLPDTPVAPYDGVENWTISP